MSVRRTGWSRTLGPLVVPVFVSGGFRRPAAAQRGVRIPGVLNCSLDCGPASRGTLSRKCMASERCHKSPGKSAFSPTERETGGPGVLLAQQQPERNVLQFQKEKFRKSSSIICTVSVGGSTPHPDKLGSVCQIVGLPRDQVGLFSRGHGG